MPPHLDTARLERELAQLTVPRDAGRVVRVVQRLPGERRACPELVRLDVEGGTLGDRWALGNLPKLAAQVTAMRADVARLMRQDEDYEILGDNLFIELDTSRDNLPAGTRLRVGGARVEVTAKPHRGCSKFEQRVGRDAWALTMREDWEPRQLRGVHLRVLESGDVRVGDTVVVESRP